MPPVVTTKMSPDIAKYLLGSKLQPVKNILLLLFLVAEMVKNLPVIQETWVQSLGQEDPPAGTIAPLRREKYIPCLCMSNTEDNFRALDNCYWFKSTQILVKN